VLFFLKETLKLSAKALGKRSYFTYHGLEIEERDD
jgi:hypothetical protein